MRLSPDASGQSGIIFDIQRCSMHDGPGIRTTVFFKGCPLSCKWCHNPESQKILPQLACYREKCINCQLCAHIHPQVHVFKDSSHPPKHEINNSQCNFCGKCVENCPSHALKIFGKPIQADAIIDLVLKDQIYYSETEGGLTVSGGEPFFQPAFLLTLLKKAKRENISTCVETSGYVSRKTLADVMNYIDYFLYDYKETSLEKHKLFTGAENSLILNNLDFLYYNQKKIILRCPIIPGYNDTSEHFQGIASMEKKYPGLLGIEILPYHDLGKTKAEAIGNLYEVSAATVDEPLKMQWKEALHHYGCSRKLLESF